MCYSKIIGKIESLGAILNTDNPDYVVAEGFCCEEDAEKFIELLDGYGYPNEGIFANFDTGKFDVRYNCF